MLRKKEIDDENKLFGGMDITEEERKIF